MYVLGLGLVVASHVAPQTEPVVAPVLRVGDTITVALAPGDPPLPGRGGLSRRFVLELDGRAVTITLGSDADAYLRIEGPGGEVWAEDDDGGIETDARIVLTGRTEPACTVVAVSKKRPAELSLSVQAGEVALPTGAALLDAEIAWRFRAAERALARDDREAAGGHLLVIGNRRVARGQFVEARRAFEESLAIQRALENRAGIAGSARNLANALVSLGEFPRARELYEESLALERELENPTGIATTIGNLGNVHFGLGNYQRARELYEESLELARAAGDRAGEERSLDNIGMALGALGEYSSARAVLEERLDLSRARGTNTRHALYNLGSVCFYQADYARARELYEECLALAEAAGDRDWIALCFAGLGNVENARGDLERACEYYEQFLDIADGAADRWDRLKVLVNFGAARARSGRYREAIELFDESLALSLELGDRAGEASVLASLSSAWHSLGDDDRALEHGEKALEMLTALGDRQGIPLVLGTLGSVHLDRADYARSLELQQRRLALARTLGDREQEAAALGAAGDARLGLGDIDGARACFEQQLVLARAIGVRTTEAAALGSLGDLAHVSGDPRRASELLTQADELGRQSGTQPIRFALALAQVALTLGDAAAVRMHVERAEQRLEELSANGLDSRQASGIRGEFAELDAVVQDLTALRLAAVGADARGRAEVLAYGFASAGRWKGRALLEGIAEHRAGARSAERIAKSRAHRTALAEHGALLADVSSAIHAERPSAEVDALRAGAAAKLAEVRALASELRSRVPGDGALDLPLGTSPDEVREAVLGAGELLVEYVAGDQRLYAYVVGERVFELVDLGPQAELASEAHAYVQSLRRPDAAGPGEIAAAGQSLFARLLAPALALADAPIERLVIVPNAPLAGLPLEALVVASNGGTRFADLSFVLDHYEVTYGPSTPVLVELAGTPARERPGTVLALADPLYPSELESEVPVVASAGAQPLRARPDPDELLRLPGTRTEALELAALLGGEGAAIAELQSARSGSLETQRFALHLGREASRERLAADLRGQAVLHLACHGFVDAEDPQRSGIALASPDGRDAWFTIADAAELDLDADLVVLSACQTAEGEIRAGEGVESLARAFLYAGARGVIASVWQVDDRAAAATMEAFYRGWLRGGLAPASALRAARLALRRGEVELGAARGIGVGGDAAPGTVGHPFFWAPFLHVGLARSVGRTPPGPR